MKYSADNTKRHKCIYCGRTRYESFMSLTEDNKWKCIVYGIPCTDYIKMLKSN